MAELVLTNLTDDVLRRLQERAASEGRTPAEEAKAILSQALNGKAADAWAPVDAIYYRLAASGRTYSDSGDLLREDRDR